MNRSVFCHKRVSKAQPLLACFLLMVLREVRGASHPGVTAEGWVADGPGVRLFMRRCRFWKSGYVLELPHRSRILALLLGLIADGCRCLSLATSLSLAHNLHHSNENYIHHADQKCAKTWREILLEAFVQLFLWK